MDSFNINVEPNNKIFEELGNNTYEYVDLLAELIDNSIAAKYRENVVNIEIEIGYSKNNREVEYLIVKDNAKGIKKDMLAKAISPAALSGGCNLNEHGLGMKQAIAALGELKYLKTKTKDIDYEMVINEFKFGNIEVKRNFDIDYESGTEIKIENVKSIVPFAPQSYTQNVAVKLGAIYRRFLRPDSKRANIEIILKNLDKDQEGKYLDLEPSKWTIEEKKPTYFHPNKRINEPIIINKKLSGRDWEAELTFGYAPTEDQYSEMGLTKPLQYEPYNVSINKQGLDIIRNDRVIKLHQLSEIRLVNTKHSKYNYIRGEIDLIHGFTTAITKNNIIENKNFIELISKIKELLNKNNFLNKKTYPSELPEKVLQQRLKNHFINSSIMKKEKVQIEYPIEGLGGYIDILADNEAWELKNSQAGGLEVYQLFAYMDMGNIEKGFLVAESFTTGAESAKNFINKNHKKEIKLIPLKEFPINNPPTKEELEKYF